MILDIQKKLNSFSEKHKLIEKSTKCCKVVIQSFYKEEKELEINTLKGILEENIRIKFNSQFLINNRVNRHSPCFKTKMSIFNNEGKTEVFNEMKYIGFYELDVDENGEIFDDWLIFE